MNIYEQFKKLQNNLKKDKDLFISKFDINFETQENVTYDDYIRMITYKTGVLSASSFEIGTRTTSM